MAQLPWEMNWGAPPVAPKPWEMEWGSSPALPSLGDVAEDEAPEVESLPQEPVIERPQPGWMADRFGGGQITQAAEPAPAAPVAPDPFAGETTGDLLTRRGQQAAAGAAQAVAGVPEAAAIVGRPIALRRRDSAIEAAAGYADEIAKLEQEAQQPGIDPRKATAIRNEIGRLGRLRDMAANLAAVTTEEGVDRPLSESLGFQAGTAIKQAVEDRFGRPDPADQSFWGMVAQGAGNVAGMVATAVPTAGAGGFASGIGMTGRGM